MNFKSKQIIVETSNECNLNCKICPRDKYKFKPSSMEIYHWCQLLMNIDDLDVKSFDFCGFGEPLADMILKTRLKNCKERWNAKTYISTNATLLTPEKWKWIDNDVDYMKVSLYGWDKESYKINHNKNMWKKARDNIKGFLAYKTNTKVLGVYTDAFGDYLHWLKYWEDIFDEVVVWRPHNWAGLFPYRPMEKPKSSCNRPFTGSPYIHINGDVSVCCFDINRELVIGNIFYERMTDILNSDKLKRIQKQHKANNYKGLICNKCCQTFHDETNLVYSNNNTKIDTLTSNKLTLRNTK